MADASTVHLLKPMRTTYKAVHSQYARRIAMYLCMASTTKHTAIDIAILTKRGNLPASVCCLGPPVLPLLLVRSEPSALCPSPLGMLPPLPLVAP